MIICREIPVKSTVDFLKILRKYYYIHEYELSNYKTLFGYIQQVHYWSNRIIKAWYPHINNFNITIDNIHDDSLFPCELEDNIIEPHAHGRAIDICIEKPCKEVGVDFYIYLLRAIASLYGKPGIELGLIRNSEARVLFHVQL